MAMSEAEKDFRRKLKRQGFVDALDSSVLTSATYEPGSDLVAGDLTLSFTSGSIYIYRGVLWQDAADLFSDASHGEYFNSDIRDNYPFLRVF